MRHLAAELGEEFNVRVLGEEVVKPQMTEADKEKASEKEEDAKKVEVVGTIDELRALAMECATFLLHHNAEPDAVDLLEELEIVDRIAELADENTYERVCQYMVAWVTSLVS